MGERGRQKCRQNFSYMVYNGIITSHVSLGNTKMDLKAFSFPFFIPKVDVH